MESTKTNYECEACGEEIERLQDMIFQTIMSDEKTCACGNPDGANSECERCVLISELTDLKKHIASAKDAIQRSIEHSSMMRDAYSDANGDLDKTAQWHYWMGRMQAQNEILVQFQKQTGKDVWEE